MGSDKQIAPQRAMTIKVKGGERIPQKDTSKWPHYYHISWPFCARFNFCPILAVSLFWFSLEMAEYDLLVVNGLVVTDQETGEFDIAIRNGKIAKLGSRGSLLAYKAKNTIDAQGGMVMV